MERFVYVFSEEARDKLLALGYKLIRSDDANDTYVFENETSLSFSLSGISVVKTNTLMF